MSTIEFIENNQWLNTAIRDEDVAALFGYAQASNDILTSLDTLREANLNPRDFKTGLNDLITKYKSISEFCLRPK